MELDRMVLNRPSPLKPYPAPDLQDKIRRALWNLVNTTLYRVVPTPFFGPRRAMLRLFGAQIAGDALPYPGITVWAPWNLVMHENSCMADGVKCYNVGKITIGKDTTVSQGAYLCSPSHEFRQPSFPLISADIDIGSAAWIATDAFVGPGVTVASRAIVGARAVVMKSVPKGAIVVGNPAQIVGQRD